MKAIILKKYGPPSLLELQDVPKPMVKPNEVLVKIYATAINDYDWSMVRGRPLLYRMLYGLLKPKHRIPGMELAGMVEAIGENVTKFKKGDGVYGDTSEFGFGTFAEYMAINENALAPKPPDMDFCQAAAIPHASLLALQGLYDIGGLQKGEKVLINGGGGGVGTFGLQLAKNYGAEVTGVDTGNKLGMMKSLGLDHVIDYKKEDFTKNGLCYDLILDTKTNRPPSAYMRALTPNGRYVTVGGKPGRLLQILIIGLFAAPLSKKKLSILALKPNRGLEKISTLWKEGKLRCVIDGPYSLEEAPERIQYFGLGEHSGKVVLSIRNDSI